MWFRSNRLRGESRPREGAAATRRGSRKFGPRTVETLEIRALMSHAGHRLVPQDIHAMALRQTRFVQTNLVSDGSVTAPVIDKDLGNPWGLAASPKSPWWINDNHTGLSTLYNGAGAKQGLVVTIPPPAGSPAGTTSSPNGMVFNGNTSDFVVSQGGKSGPSAFIFATEDGTISGWNFGVNTTNAILAVDNSGSGAVYKGLALANNGGSDFLYATNFHAGTIDVFDSSFHQVTLASSAFTDSKLPKGFAPFGIASITPPGSSQNLLFVTYAMQKADKHDDLAGRGHGFVDVFDASGNLLQRVASRGTLNSPWGIALAPSNFGRNSGELLIGNFGDGRINAFKFPQGTSHRFAVAGQLLNTRGKPITISGLWGLAFGNGANAGPNNTLFFTAGVNHEAGGLFGTLTTS
jgi:uncharacterized protein (TIGR03118 family)